MFNLARKRMLPKTMRQEELVFLSKPEQQKMQEDAKGLAFIMVRHGISEGENAMTMMDGVEYWQYLREFRPKYIQKVFELADTMAKHLAVDFQANPQKYPLPAPPQSGGGMPPAGAKATKMTIIANIETTVLPSGTILVRRGDSYDLRIGNEIVSFEAKPEDAIRLAMQRENTLKFGR